MKKNNTFLTIPIFLPFTRNLFPFVFLLILFILKKYKKKLFLTKIDKKSFSFFIPLILFFCIFFLLILNVPVIEAQTKVQVYDPLEAFVIHVTRVFRFIYMLLCALMNVTLAALNAASPLTLAALTWL